MQTDLTDLLAGARVFAVPLIERFRGVTVRDGVLLRGPAGWAEFAPFHDYADADCVPWLRAAIDTATVPWPAPVRRRIEINVTIPVVSPERAAELVLASGCRTAKVKVADPGRSVQADAARVAAVRAALGPDGRIRVDANGAWSVALAVESIALLDDAAQGLEYVEQPCRSLPELAEVRARVRPPIAADESIRRAADPERVALAGAADIAVIKVAPLGGVPAALRVARAAGLPVVVSSAVDTSVGLAAGLALAGALPELPFACGLGTRALLTSDVTSTPARESAGFLAVPRAAPEPDRWTEVRADRSTTDYWSDRLRMVAELLSASESRKHPAGG
ncbi:MAG TPA: o-succinylbenzoate synthase [Nakamurella sp.]|nr:o-succinylbenzoate synthase [Nakamurella sp.]